jgi:hypothetical protein
MNSSLLHDKDVCGVTILRIEKKYRSRARKALIISLAAIIASLPLLLVIGGLLKWWELDYKSTLGLCFLLMPYIIAIIAVNNAEKDIKTLLSCLKK